MMNSTKYYAGMLLALCGISIFPGYAQPKVAPAVEVQGSVFHDTNKNGMRDKGERYLSNVWVSNGVDLVKTNRRGHYSLSAKEGQSIFAIPSSSYHYANKNKRSGNAQFLYLSSSTLTSDTVTHDIALLRSPKGEGSFQFGAIGDVQVDNLEELNYAASTLVAELHGRQDLDFNIFLGDLVNDDMSLLPPMAQLLQQIGVPAWTVLGNHDRHVAPAALLNGSFNETFGADRYAFNHKDVHFVVLNNVYATGKNSYEGRLSEDDLTFLKNNLQQVDKNTPIVLAQHIPMAHTRNRKEIFELLKGFRQVLILTGHTHTVNRFVYRGTTIHELGVGATCGNWWRGEKDAAGIPEALMRCGTPRGYFTVTFDAGAYTINYKGVGLPASQQMDIHYKEGQLLATIYGASDSTTVTVQIDQGAWQPMQQVNQVAPRVAQVVARNKAGAYPSSGSLVNPLRARASKHVWALPTASPLGKGPVAVRIQAADAYGYAVEQTFFLEI